jgi:hypothetical protein
MENLKFPCIIADVEVGMDMGPTITVPINRVVNSQEEYNALMLEISEKFSPKIDFYAHLMEKNGWTRQQAKMAMFPFNYGTGGTLSKAFVTKEEASALMEGYKNRHQSMFERLKIFATPSTGPESVFLIERAWINYKNHTKGSCIGYDFMGFVMTEEEAKDICNNGKTFTETDCWAINKELPQFIYKEIKHYDRRYEKG